MKSQNNVKKHRLCPVCNDDDYLTLFTKRGFDYVTCNTCKMMYINPMPDNQTIVETYDTYGSDYFTRPEKIEADFHKARHSRETKILERFAKQGRLLDVGCATGSFLSAATDIGFAEVVGLDISQPSVQFAAHLGLNALAGNFLDRPFPKESFDVVTMWATLEHLPEPMAFVDEAHRVLAPGGLLIISVPNLNSLTHRLLKKRYRYIGSDHLNYFSNLTLQKLLVDRGFSIQHHETHAINPLVIIGDLYYSDRFDEKEVINNQLLHTARTYRIKTQESFRVFRVLHRFMKKAVSLMGIGDLLIMVSRKRDESKYTDR